ncbi:MAG: hypothetical protein JWM02_1325 [Frankiales bacterium]|nr:hypothetical protein [Frankiales bacterium]
MPAADPPRVLCAVLASPPLTSGGRTRGALALAADLLGCDIVRIVNLLALPTRDLPEMSEVGAEGGAWEAGRPELLAGLQAGDALLAAWGVSALTGAARVHHRSQVAWLVDAAAEVGCDRVWTVGPQPRHPSRWHQYVSDRHRRTSTAATTAERLGEVLLQREWASLLPTGPAAHARR